MELALQQLTHPIHMIFIVAKNLLVNGVDVLREIEGAVQCWKEKDFFCSGENAGELLGRLLVATKQLLDGENRAALALAAAAGTVADAGAAIGGAAGAAAGAEVAF